METPTKSKTLISANSQPMFWAKPNIPPKFRMCKPKEIVDLDRSVLWNVIIDPIADDLAHQQNNNDY